MAVSSEMMSSIRLYQTMSSNQPIKGHLKPIPYPMDVRNALFSDPQKIKFKINFHRSDDGGTGIRQLSKQFRSIAAYKTPVYQFTNSSHQSWDSSNSNVQSHNDHNDNIFCVPPADMDFSALQIVQRCELKLALDAAIHFRHAVHF